jgi:hypothetical protein
MSDSETTSPFLKKIFTPAFMTKTQFIDFIQFILIGDKIFFELPNKSALYQQARYYDLADFSGSNIIRRFAARDFSQESNLWHLRKPHIALAENCSIDADTDCNHIAHYLLNHWVMREICTYQGNIEVYSKTQLEELVFSTRSVLHTTANIFRVTATGEYVYVINNVVYSEHFPIAWALTPRAELNGFIYGPGTSPTHCKQCAISKSANGAFVGYCNTCIAEYPPERASGYIDDGFTAVDYDEPIYNPMGEPINTNARGYDCTALCCLSGGPLPTGPDICDNQADVDPFCDVEEAEILINTSKIQPSLRHPRRGYGILSTMYSHSQLFRCRQTDKMTPDFIRTIMEDFFANYDLEIHDNNYSFPIGPRADWDHYRIEKRPTCWYCWYVSVQGDDEYHEAAELYFRLYVSHVHTNIYPAHLLLECSNFRGRIYNLWPLLKILRETLIASC